jgi:putative peptidoglycan lipid II flippase
MLRRLTSALFNRKTFLASSSVLIFTAILSTILGLIRDRMLTTTFGATRTLDAYNASFVLPDLILNIFIAGALSAAFIPVFTDVLNKNDKKEQSRFISSVVNGALLVVIASGTILYFALPWLSQYTVAGFDETSRELYINITRLLLLSPIIFAISNTLGSILITRERFFWFGFSAPLYNLGIIIGIAWLGTKHGIYGAVYGALGGALLHLLSRLVGVINQVKKHNLNIKYKIHIWFDNYYRSFLRLMAPKMIGQPLEQITLLGYTIIASTLGAGSIAIFTLSRNFHYAPIAIIGTNLAVAMFPALSRHVATENKTSYKNELRFTAYGIFLITSFASLVIFLLRFWLIDSLLGGGQFDEIAVTATASALGWFCLSIPTESLNQLLARAFYALKDSATPVVIGLISIVVAIVTGYLLSKSMGVNGLVLGFFLGSALRLGLLVFLLRKKLVR